MRTPIDPDESRPLTAGYPGLEALGVQHYTENQDRDARTLEVIRCISKLIDLSRGARTVCVLGCGPRPEGIKKLVEAGYAVTGVEPVEGSAVVAREFTGGSAVIVTAGAEALPLADGSQRVVLMESVLEHVDSPERCVREAFRVLEPGGILYVYTTNRHRFSWTGQNGEFNVPFFNWLPRLVKESYVFRHLHFDPRLANFTPRPAVHWFTYADLCQLGRSAGFAQFYSLLDVVDEEAPWVSGSAIRKAVFRRLRLNPWLRGAALMQVGNSIFMWKRERGG